jgi:sarcosine oxidase gamma subunit
MAQTSTERVRAMRERRRKALEAAGAAEFALRPADQLLAPAVAVSIAALDLKPEDAAAAKLAELLAKTIDRAESQEWAVRWIGPELLRVLGELGGTPAARAKVKPAKPAQQARSTWLDDMRRARRQYPGGA